MEPQQQLLQWGYRHYIAGFAFKVFFFSYRLSLRTCSPSGTAEAEASAPVSARRLVSRSEEATSESLKQITVINFHNGVMTYWICQWRQSDVGLMVRGEQFPTTMEAVLFYLWVYVAFETFQVQTSHLPGERPRGGQAVRESTWSRSLERRRKTSGEERKANATTPRMCLIWFTESDACFLSATHPGCLSLKEATGSTTTTKGHNRGNDELRN